MDLGVAVVTRLEAAGPVTALVGGAPDERIFWVRRPQGSELPAVVLRQVSSIPAAETVEDEGGMWLTRLQCDCMARTYTVARQLAQAVGNALIEPATVGDMDFWNGDREGPVDLGEDTTQGYVHRATLDVILRHSTGS